MIENLLIGLPEERPGGLVLTLLVAFASGALALVGGFVYAAFCVVFPRASLPLQAGGAVVRGIPVLLLMFFLAQLSSISLVTAGVAALSLYSFSHVGEILRSFLAAYPSSLAEQARVSGVGIAAEWFRLRVPWTFGRALDALATHWISLLKDTGALVVLGVGELTTAAKALSESSASEQAWFTALITAGALYLAATLFLIQTLELARKRSFIGALA